jgi:hypothetical protein
MDEWIGTDCHGFILAITEAILNLSVQIRPVPLIRVSAAQQHIQTGMTQVKWMNTDLLSIPAFHVIRIPMVLRRQHLKLFLEVF